jgi:hypothetical protein
MLDFTTLKPDFEGTIGECKWSFKVFIFKNEFPREGYFQGFIFHDAKDGGIEPITGILSDTSLEINEDETFGDGQNSMRYEFSFLAEDLTPGYKINGKQIRLAKMIRNVYRNSHIRDAIIWKC